MSRTMTSEVNPILAAPTVRMALVDGLRGFAALWVAAYHFYNTISEHNRLDWIQPVQQFLSVGDLGVMVFFVLSGFVIACSVNRARVTGRYVGIFAVRRSLRLDPTYWTIIWVTCFVAVVKGGPLGSGQHTYSTTDVLLNMCYLNRLVQAPTIVTVGWTLCLEVQFYLVFVLTCWLAQKVLRGAPSVGRQCIFLVPVTMYSLAVHYELLPEPHPGLFVSYWYLFFLGTMTWYVVARELSPWWLLPLVAVVIGKIDLASAIAAATAVGLFLAGRLKLLGLTQNWRSVQFLGKLSYSFYLVHPLIGNRFLRAVLARWHGSVTGLAAIGLFFAALAVSLAAAAAVFWLIERPSHLLSRRVAKFLERGKTTCCVAELAAVKS